MLESGADIDEEDKERYEKQLGKLCDQVRISHNAIVEVEDFVIENFKLQISIAHVYVEHRLTGVKGCFHH